MKRAARYVRVSRDEQARGYSPETQVNNVAAYCQKIGVEAPDEWLIVSSESAWKRGRGDFARLVSLLGRKRGPEIVVFDRVDRSARNLTDTATLLESLVDDHGVEVHSAQDGLVVSRGGPSGSRIMWAVQAIMARDFADTLSKRVRECRQTKLASGGWPHQAPLGLLNVHVSGGRSYLAIDPDRAPLVRQLAEAVASDGLTVDLAVELAERIGLRSRSGRSIGRASMARLLRHPVLAGLVPGPDGLMAGTHEPVIPRATWEHVQSALDSRAKGQGPRQSVHVHAYAGLMACDACGRAVVCEHQRGRHGRGSYSYYRCASGSRSPCGRLYVREEAITEQAAAILSTLVLPDDYREAIVADRRRQAESERKALSESMGRLTRRREDIRAKLDTALDRLLDGTLTREDWARVRARYERDLALADEALASAESDRMERIDDVARVLELARDLGGMMRDDDAAGRGEMMRLAFDRPRLAGKTFLADLAPPWISVARLNPPRANGVNDLRGIVSSAHEPGRYPNPWTALTEDIAEALAADPALRAWVRAA